MAPRRQRDQTPGSARRQAAGFGLQRRAADDPAWPHLLHLLLQPPPLRRVQNQSLLGLLALRLRPLDLLLLSGRRPLHLELFQQLLHRAMLLIEQVGQRFFKPTPHRETAELGPDSAQWRAEALSNLRLC